MKNLLALSLLLPSLAYAATVKFSEELIPLQVNENKVEHSLFSSVDEVTVSQGQHKIRVKYKDLYEIDYDEHEVIESEPFWLVVNIENNEATYQLSMPRADDIDGAKQYIKSPFATFKEQGANSQALRLEPVKAQVVLSTEQKNKAYLPATTASAPSNSAAPKSSSKIHVDAEKSPNAPVSQQPSALSMLEFWWSQASEQEKAAFLANKKGS
ncbi:DUF2057 family protein [Pseudoalteromonas sp. MMG024]|uniref:DUF2057 family protein n=1 Tax=Pseudoalteromonas sp. MMG024 TaxID=2909980 RepID=UPI001F17E62D|nr:DUF2057 family protein [Pseudoalteromonas sp. MMG024]MCF6458646.1 DUF2057 domain-containing protein [Pseudoalteromonas sp. MMG024]